MLRFILSILFILSLTVNIFSQGEKAIDEDYARFRQIFEREVESLEDSSFSGSKLPYHISPAKLPAWFYNVPAPGGDTSFYIGISDPGLDSVAGLKQATERALLIHSLLSHIKIRYLRDLYNQEYLEQRRGDFHAKFEELYHLSPTIPAGNYMYDTLAVDSTKFGETLVLLGIYKNTAKKSSKQDPATFSAFCYNTEYRHLNDYERNIKVEIMKKYPGSGREAAETLYTWSRTGKIADILSFQDKNQQVVEAAYFKYRSNIDSTDQTNINGILYYGLWFGYISSIMSVVQQEVQPVMLSVEKVDEFFSKKFRDFSREISVMEASFGIQHINIVNNRMYIDIQRQQ